MEKARDVKCGCVGFGGVLHLLCRQGNLDTCFILAIFSRKARLWGVNLVQAFNFTCCTKTDQVIFLKIIGKDNIVYEVVEVGKGLGIRPIVEPIHQTKNGCIEKWCEVVIIDILQR
jgi:hypothetical protein